MIESRPSRVMKTRAEAGAATTQQFSIVNAHWLFVGLGPALVRDVPYAGLVLLFMRFFKAHAFSWLPPTIGTMGAGVVAAVCATAITQPADVLRTRLIIEEREREAKDKGATRRSSFATLQRLLRARGVLALFAGMTPRLVRRALQQAITWGMLELMAGASAQQAPV